MSVVVASHGRPGRLSTLLDALEAQTLSADAWELVIVHTYDRGTAAELLEGRELARTGRMRHAQVGPAEARPSRQRNAGWHMARGELIVFTDDDCRPAQDWLERLVAAARANPGSIIQGAAQPDPREEHLFARPHISTLRVDPPSREVQTCNVLYERALLERVGGFDERAITGEDIDLSIRARDAGAELVGAGDALTYHAIDALSLAEKIRSQHKWQHLAYVVARNPRLRDWCTWRVWWKQEHLGAVLALLALAGAPRRRWMLLALLPYLQMERTRHGSGRRQQLRALRELPAHWVIELAEVGSFARGSLRYRTFLL